MENREGDYSPVRTHEGTAFYSDIIHIHYRGAVPGVGTGGTQNPDLQGHGFSGCAGGPWTGIPAGLRAVKGDPGPDLLDGCIWRG